MPFLYAPWATAGRYAVISAMDWETEETCLHVEYTYTLANPERDQMVLRYTVTGDGMVEAALTWVGPRTPQVPEFGLMLFLPGVCRRVEYYGLGPEENYCDRRAGAKLGRYLCSAEENLSPYSTPQECGSRCGVRWAKVLDDHGHGLRVEGDGMVLNFLPYTPEELEAAPHLRELPPSERTVLRCLLGQMGIAGDNSWGAKPHPEDLLTLKPGETFRFRFQGI